MEKFFFHDGKIINKEVEAGRRVRTSAIVNAAGG
jgi:hypothetical protein